ISTSISARSSSGSAATSKPAVSGTEAPEAEWNRQVKSARPARRLAARIGSTEAASESALVSAMTRMPTASGAASGAKMVRSCFIKSFVFGQAAPHKPTLASRKPSDECGRALNRSPADASSALAGPDGHPGRLQPGPRGGRPAQYRGADLLEREL